MEHQGHRQRMRQRYRAEGLAGFAPHEVLELALFYAIPQRNVNPLAHRLIDRFGSLHGVLEATAEELQQVDGVGEYAATLLTLFSAVAKKSEQSRQGPRVALSSRAQAEKYCIALVGGEKREHFYAICLNAQMQVLGDALVAVGSLSEVPAYPRVVAQEVLSRGAHSVLLCHNHPGGSLLPSAMDMETTRQLADMLHRLEVVLCDHVIVANGQAFSMVRHHLIEQEITTSGVATRVADPQGEVLIKHELQKKMKQENQK